MGLDVYLYHSKDRKASRKKEALYEKKSEKNWTTVLGSKTYEQATEDEKERVSALNKKLAADMGLDEYGSDNTGKTEISENSTVHPEHMFKIGYMRSSYNDGGINRVLDNAIGKTLGYIFGAGDEYEFTPDWVASLDRAKGTLAEFKLWCEKYGKYSVQEYGFNPFTDPKELPTSDQNAMERAVKVIEEHAKNGSGGWFSNRDGHFFLPGKSMWDGEKELKPLQVLAVMPGTKVGFAAALRGQEPQPEPCFYVLTDNPDGYTWYIEALEVVVEMIEWVLGKSDPENYYFHWSG